MPVPSSGQLRLRADINQEVNGNDTDDNVSLGTLSNDVGFSEPDTMSEFYSYTSCTAPSVTTNSMSSVSYTSMTANGNVTADNGCTVTERGFYFGTNGSSPTNNTKYTSGSGTGSYSRSMTGLNSTQTYYCWAYATNSAGTTYGSRVQAQTLTPATYSLINTTTNTMKWSSPQQMSWSHLQISADAMWSASARGEYNHASYGWTTYNSAGNTGWGTRPSSGYAPYINDSRYKRTDQTQVTAHRARMNGTLSNGSIPAYNAFQSFNGGSAITPSGCTSGATTGGASYSYSGCNWGCGTSSTMNCNCGNTSPSWMNGTWHEAAHAGTSSYQNVQTYLQINGC